MLPKKSNDPEQLELDRAQLERHARVETGLMDEFAATRVPPRAPEAPVRRSFWQRLLARLS